jgi:hypothetical protein
MISIKMASVAEEEITYLDPSSCANLRSDVVSERLSEKAVDPAAMKKAMAQEVKAAKQGKKDKEKENEKAAKAAEKAGEQMRRKQEEEEARMWAEEEAHEKQLALDKISLYREKFKHLKKRNTVSARSSLDEVLDEVHYIEMQLGSGDPGGQNPACFALIAGMSGIEALTENYYNPLELKLNGLGQTTRDNISKFEPLLDEMMIKHGHNMVMSVEWRLALVIGTTVLTVHAANSGMQFPGNIQAASSISAKEAKGSDDEL